MTYIFFYENYDIYKTEAAKAKPNVEEGSYDALKKAGFNPSSEWMLS